jgi:phosphohistidine phosphatase
LDLAGGKLRSVQVYLIRHAEAVPEDDAGADQYRWLSARGREAARGLARLLREQKVELDAIITSPLPRALQTAELVANGLDFFAPITVHPSLQPGGHPRPVALALPSYGVAVAVVGHEPGISMLGAYLIGKPSFPQLRTAQACAIADGAPIFTARTDLMQVLPLLVE